jgi:nucleoside-diphosphate-sugar epimerase
MKIVVTGGSGYLGTKLVNVLSKIGYEVTSLDSAYFSHCWLGPKTSNTEQVLFAQSIVPSNLKGIDVVIHLAGISNDPLKQITESELYDPSLDYTLKLAKLCRDKHIRFIFASSCSIYGKQNITADEESVVYPQTPYSSNKMAIEKLLQSIETISWKPMILRFATIYGFSPRMRFDTVINMLCGLSIVERRVILNSNGKAQRPFLFIDDAIKSLVWFLKSDSTKLIQENMLSTIINIGSNSENYTIENIASIVSEVQGGLPIEKRYSTSDEINELNKDKKILDGADTRSYFVNFDKFKKICNSEIDFTPMNVGIQLTINELLALELSAKEFYDTKYYRLQELERLVDTNVLDRNLNYVL